MGDDLFTPLQNQCQQLFSIALKFTNLTNEPAFQNNDCSLETKNEIKMLSSSLNQIAFGVNESLKKVRTNSNLQKAKMLQNLSELRNSNAELSKKNKDLTRSHELSIETLKKCNETRLNDLKCTISSLREQNTHLQSELDANSKELFDQSINGVDFDDMCFDELPHNDISPSSPSISIAKNENNSDNEADFLDSSSTAKNENNDIDGSMDCS